MSSRTFLEGIEQYPIHMLREEKAVIITSVLIELERMFTTLSSMYPLDMVSENELLKKIETVLKANLAIIAVESE